MYGVNCPNEYIDYAAEAAKQNVEILGGRCDELKRENAELRECLIEAIQSHCVNCSNVTWGPLKTNPDMRVINGCNMRHCCPVENWRAALKGVNHAND